MGNYKNSFSRTRKNYFDKWTKVDDLNFFLLPFYHFCAHFLIVFEQLVTVKKNH